MRVHATIIVDGEKPTRKLVRIECDHIGCDAFVKPHADIARSGWTMSAQQDLSTREVHIQDFCPIHGNGS